MRILITGSRDWDDRLTLISELEGLTLEFKYSFTYELTKWVLVSGACPTGADALAEEWARDKGITVERHPADWKTHGRGAGPIRNKEMVDLDADICMAFIRNKSKGASGTASLAENAGIETRRTVQND